MVYLYVYLIMYGVYIGVRLGYVLNQYQHSVRVCAPISPITISFPNWILVVFGFG